MLLCWFGDCLLTWEKALHWIAPVNWLNRCVPPSHVLSRASAAQLLLASLPAPLAPTERQASFFACILNYTRLRMASLNVQTKLLNETQWNWLKNKFLRENPMFLALECLCVRVCVCVFTQPFHGFDWLFLWALSSAHTFDLSKYGHVATDKTQRPFGGRSKYGHVATDKTQRPSGDLCKWDLVKETHPLPSQLSYLKTECWEHAWLKWPSNVCVCDCVCVWLPLRCSINNQLVKGIETFVG